VISIPGLRERDITQVRVSTCNPGRIFFDAQAADGWLDQHPEEIVLPSPMPIHNYSPSLTGSSARIRPVGLRRDGRRVCRGS
jgi:hypothetical protein